MRRTSSDKQGYGELKLQGCEASDKATGGSYRNEYAPSAVRFEVVFGTHKFSSKNGRFGMVPMQAERPTTVFYY